MDQTSFSPNVGAAGDVAMQPRFEVRSQVAIVAHEDAAAESCVAAGLRVEVTEGTPSDAEAEVLAVFQAPADPRAPAQAAQKRTPEEVPTPGPMYDFESRPIGSLTVRTACRAGDVPADVGREKLAQMQAKASDDVVLRNWPLTCYRWEAPALCHRPLYFEEVNLERFGYGPRYLRIAQPVISAGQFFTTVPILPYKMFAEPARQCVYTLGQYRPGSPVPYDIEFPPGSWSGAGAESLVITGLIFAIP